MNTQHTNNFRIRIALALLWNAYYCVMMGCVLMVTFSCGFVENVQYATDAVAARE